MANYRVVCPSCKKPLNIPDDCTCPMCRNPITIPRGGMIQIYRMGNFVGGAAGAGIYINGQPYGHVANRGTVLIPLPFGDYMVHMVLNMNRKCNDPVIKLTPEKPVAYLKAHVRVGAFVNSMIIEPADPASMPPPAD